MIKFLDLQAQYQSIKRDIDLAVADVIESAGFIGGTRVREFEEAFAEFQAATHCVGVGNGTDAIEIALEALDLPAGSEIIVPANSFIASSEAVTRAGHRVVFADTDPDSYLIDLDDVRRRLNSRTAAIVVVHLYGRPMDMTSVMALADEHGLRVIEDAAQAHGARHQGTPVGALGDIGAFSFYPGKNLGAYGDGGAIVTNDASLAQRCRMIANHGRTDKYVHQFEGRNSRLDALQAAVLSVKLRQLDRWIEQRNAVASAYLEGLVGTKGLELPSPLANGDRHAYHLFVVRTPDPESLAAHLKEKGIATGRHYPVALPAQPAYAYLDSPTDKLVAIAQDEHLLSLPIGEHLSTDDAAVVAAAVREFMDS